MSNEGISTETTRRGPGRPRREDGPAFPEREVDDLLVSGEQGPDGKRVYPSIREVAERFGVSHSTIGEYSQRHSCMKRQREQRRRAQELADERAAEVLAAELTCTKANVLKLRDTLFARFTTDVKEGRVRDGAQEIAAWFRVCSLSEDEASSQPQNPLGFTLEDIQDRYQQRRERDAREAATPALTGRVVKS